MAILGATPNANENYEASGKKGDPGYHPNPIKDHAGKHRDADDDDEEDDDEDDDDDDEDDEDDCFAEV